MKSLLLFLGPLILYFVCKISTCEQTFHVILCRSVCVFIRLWAARGFHTITNVFISFFLPFQRKWGGPQWESGSNGSFVWMEVMNVCAKPVSSNCLSQCLGLGFVRMVLSECPLCLLAAFNHSVCLSSLTSMTKQNKAKKLSSEVELFKHPLALYPVSSLSGPFPRAPYS